MMHRRQASKGLSPSSRFALPSSFSLLSLLSVFNLSCLDPVNDEPLPPFEEGISEDGGMYSPPPPAETGSYGSGASGSSGTSGYDHSGESSQKATQYDEIFKDETWPEFTEWADDEIECDALEEHEEDDESVKQVMRKIGAHERARPMR